MCTSSCFWPERITLSPHQQPLTHPLLIQLPQLLCHSGHIQGQSKAVDVQLRDHVLQSILEREPPDSAMLGSSGCGILKNGPPESDQLQNMKKSITGLTSGRRALPAHTSPCQEL